MSDTRPSAARMDSMLVPSDEVQYAEAKQTTPVLPTATVVATPVERQTITASRTEGIARVRVIPSSSPSSTDDTF
jgi:hypothetical protein